MPAHVEEALLRIVQEALANVRKHAAASRVTVTLSYLDDVTMLDMSCPEPPASVLAVAAAVPET